MAETLTLSRALTRIRVKLAEDLEEAKRHEDDREILIREEKLQWLSWLEAQVVGQDDLEGRLGMLAVAIADPEIGVRQLARGRRQDKQDWRKALQLFLTELIETIK